MSLLPADPQQRQKALLTFLAIALVGYLAHEYLYQPRAAEAAALEARLANLQSLNRATRAVVDGADTARLERQVAFYLDQLALVEALIPSAAELPDLLDALSLQAQGLDLEISLIRPTGAVAAEFYALRTYDIAVLGSYHQLADFLTRIASLPRIITPVNLSLTPAVEASRGGDTRLEATFSIETYVLPAPDLPSEKADAQ